MPLANESLARLAGTMTHRGPDGHDAWLAGSIGLVHCHFWTTPEDVDERQPVSDPERRHSITADARIDNREELMGLLADRFHARNPTDAQVILAAYDRWGDECATQLIGDFAFAIWDAPRRQLYVARDAFGVRQLYYHINETSVVLATTLSGVLATLSSTPSVNRALVSDLLREDFYRWPCETAYEGIHRLLPGHQMIVKAGSVVVKRYYTLGAGGPPPLLRSDAEYVEQFRELLRTSIRARLRSTPPVGLHLSGGLDSSSIVCLADDLWDEGNGGGRLRTYSAVFRHPPRQKLRTYIDDVLTSCRHVVGTQVECDDCWSLQEFRESDDLNAEEPEVGRIRSLRVKPLRRARADGCRVLLAGHWADEVLRGDTAYFHPQLLCDLPWRDALAEYHYFRERSSPLKIVADTIVRPLAWAVLASPRRRRGRRGGLRLQAPPLSKASARHLYNSVSGARASAQHADFDRVAAAVGIEYRYPFLDRRLVDFAVTLPSPMLFRRGITKYILRLSAGHRLPPTILERRGVPGIGDLMLRGVREESASVERLFADSRLVRGGYISRRRLDSAVAHARTSPRPRDVGPLFRLLSVETWLRREEQRSERAESCNNLT